MHNKDNNNNPEDAVVKLFKIRIEGDFEEWSRSYKDIDDDQVELVVIKKNLYDETKTTQKNFSVALSSLDLPEESFTEAEHYTDHFVVYAAVELGCSCSNPAVREYLDL